jgi:hypothetical protein
MSYITSGLLVNFHVQPHIRSGDNTQPAKVTALEVRDDVQLDFSSFWNKTFVADQRAIAHISSLRLSDVIQISVQPNADPKKKIAMGKGATNVLEVSIALKKTANDTSHLITLDKLNLVWEPVVAVINSRRGDSESAKNPPEIGAIRGFLKEDLDPRAVGGNLFVQWAKNSSGGILYGIAVEVMDSRGVKWTFINTPKDKTDMWALDSVVVYLTREEIYGPELLADMRLVMTTKQNEKVALGAWVETTTTIDTNPLKPERVLKIYNLLSQESLLFGAEVLSATPTTPQAAAAEPVTAATPGETIPWEITVRGQALIPAHTACHRGEVVSDRVYHILFKFTQNDVSRYTNYAKKDLNKPFDIASKEIGFADNMFSLNISKIDNSKFRLLSVDVRIKDT